MALFSPSESPAVVVKEIDLTGGVPNVQSTTGAIVGNFRWGPAEKRSLIANETELVEKFAHCFYYMVMNLTTLLLKACKLFFELFQEAFRTFYVVQCAE